MTRNNAEEGRQLPIYNNAMHNNIYFRILPHFSFIITISIP